MTRILLKTALIASGAALLIAAGPKADTNQDGQVTKAEYTEFAESRFYATDSNYDGLLSEEEREAFSIAERTNGKTEVFNKIDSDGDGLLSRDEVKAASKSREGRKDERNQKLLEEYDTNLDGTLSETERTLIKSELKDKLTEKKAERGDSSDRGDRGDKSERSEDGDRGERNEKRTKGPKLDADGDGFISLDEHMTVVDQLFTRLDANADGVLTKGEGKSRNGKRGR